MDLYESLFFASQRSHVTQLYPVMIATIVMVAAFKSSTNLTNAYGCVLCHTSPVFNELTNQYFRFAVATVMFTTTVLVTFQIKLVKHKPLWLALGFLVPFGFFDGLFWGAALKKIPKGAWVPFMIGCILYAIENALICSSICR